MRRRKRKRKKQSRSMSIRMLVLEDVGPLNSDWFVVNGKVVLASRSPFGSPRICQTETRLLDLVHLVSETHGTENESRKIFPSVG